MAIRAAQLIAVVSVTGADEATGKLMGVGAAADRAKGAMTGMAVGGAAILAAGLIALGAKTAQMAGDFQAEMTTMVTGAGESRKAIASVGAGLLKVAVDTATPTKKLADALFLIESAGFHGAAGVQLLQTVAQGARVGVADLAKVADVLTTTLHDYSLSAAMSVPVMNSLIQTVKNGKMVMDDLNASLKNVLPVASAFHVSLSDVEGALSTMAAAGDKGATAGTHLSMMLRGLEKPMGAAAKEMAAMGINSINLAQTMGKSLPDALQMIQDAVARHFVPGSTEYNRAIATILGGSKSGIAGLELMNKGMGLLKGNTDAAALALRTGGSAVQGWADVQQNFNFKLDKAKESMEALGIKIGTALLPYLSRFLDFLSSKGMPLLTRLSDWVIRTALPAFLRFSDWILNKALPYFQQLAKTVGDNLLPPLGALVQNVASVAEAIGSWLVQSGFLAFAVGLLSGLLGTLVGWVSDLVAGLQDGNPLVSTLAGLLTAVGVAMGLIKLQEFVSGLQASFKELQGGAGIVSNLATQAFPAFSQALGVTKTAVTGVGSAATASEGVVKAAAVGMSASMGIATLGFSLAAGVLVAAFLAAKDHVTLDFTQLSAAGQKAYNALGNSAQDVATKATASGLVQQQAAKATADETRNQGSRASAYWTSSYDAQKLSAAKASAAMILSQQLVSDAAQKAAAVAQASWSAFVNNMWAQGIDVVHGGPVPKPGTTTLPGGPHRPGFQHGGPVLASGLAMVHAGEYVLSSAMVRSLSPLSNLMSSMRTSSSAGFIPGGGQPIINVNVNVQSPDVNLDGYRVASGLMKHITNAIRYNTGVWGR